MYLTNLMIRHNFCFRPGTMPLGDGVEVTGLVLDEVRGERHPELEAGRIGRYLCFHNGPSFTTEYRGRTAQFAGAISGRNFLILGMDWYRAFLGTQWDGPPPKFTFSPSTFSHSIPTPYSTTTQI